MSTPHCCECGNPMGRYRGRDPKRKGRCRKCYAVALSQTLLLKPLTLRQRQAKALHDQGRSALDIAIALDVSSQRASQLLKRVREKERAAT